MRAFICAVVAIAACADVPTSPVPQPEHDVLVGSQMTTDSASATLDATHLTYYSHAGYRVTLGHPIDGPIVEVEYAFTFGTDQLDGGECVYFFDDMSGGGYCNPPGADPIGSTMMTFSCSTAWEVCDSFEDGNSNGAVYAYAFDGSAETSFDLTALHVVVKYSLPPDIGVGPLVIVDQFGGLPGTSINGRRLPTGGGTWRVGYGSAVLAEGAARLYMGLDASYVEYYEECQLPVPEDWCYVYGAMTLMLDEAIRTDHEIQIRIRDYQPEQGLGIWTMSEPYPWYIGLDLWVGGDGVWAITGEGDIKVSPGEMRRGDYTLRIYDVDFVAHRYSIEVVGKLVDGETVKGRKTGLNFGQSNMRALAITLQTDPDKARGAQIAGIRIVRK